MSQSPPYSMPHQKFQPGFRLSFLDVSVLVIGLLSAMILASNHSLVLGTGVAYVVGHFFLFCNVFRISRTLEMIWATIFTVLAVSAVWLRDPSWFWVFAISGAATVVVISIELRKPSYHGIGWSQINPQLTEWWKAQ